MNIVDLIYKEECYQLVGLAYEMFNKLGYGYQEKYYHRAYAAELAAQNIAFKRELLARIKYGNGIIGRYFMDFMIDNKIVIEFKVADDFYLKHINQVLAYLKATSLKLGVIMLVTKKGIQYRRIVN